MFLYSYWPKNGNSIFYAFHSMETGISSALAEIEKNILLYKPYLNTASSLLEDLEDHYNQLDVVRPENNDVNADLFDFDLQQAEPNNRPVNPPQNRPRRPAPAVARRINYNNNQIVNDNDSKKALHNSAEYNETLSLIKECKSKLTLDNINNVIASYNNYMKNIINNKSLLHSFEEINIFEQKDQE